MHKKTVINFTLFVLVTINSLTAMAQMNTKMSKNMTSIIPDKPENISPLLIGEKIPTMHMYDYQGQKNDINAIIAKKPTVLVFYRGGWCPYCSKQLSGLQEIKSSLNKLGYQLIAVSTDSPENLRKSIGQEKLEYTLLSDANLDISKQFGLAYKAPENYWDFLPKTSGGKNTEMLLPVPSIFIIAPSGIIQFEYINPDFKQRMDPDILLSMATAIASKKKN